MEKHILIAAATSEYKNLGPSMQRPELKQVLESIVQLFTVTLKLYHRELSEIGENPLKADLEEKLDDWFADKARDPSDWVVLYYTGHATVVAPESLCLLTCETKPGRLPSTSFDLGELAKIVLAEAAPKTPRRVRNLLIIVDTCFAGKGTLELAEQFRKVLWRLSGGAIYLLGAALPSEEAKAGALAEALIQSVKELSERNVTQQYLLLEELVPQINDKLALHRAICTPVFLERQKFFPNYSYVDTGGKSVPANEAQLAISSQEFREHWEPRSRGVEFDTQAGSYFSGRDAVFGQLKSYFDSATDHRTRVITGQPGAGKSAILARVVTGSLPPGTRPSAPRIGSVDLAIHAKGKTLAEVTSRLAERLGSAAKPDTVLEALKQTPKRAHIVLDALDEASEPAAIADQLLRPMGQLESVKLLVGTRKNFARSLGEAEVIDIDRSQYAKKEDIASYVRARLLGTGEPGRETRYAGKTALAGDIAERVAESAYPNFLVSRLITEDLLNRPETLDSESFARTKLPRKVSGAFEAYLARFGDREKTVRDLLLPLVYAEGAGLPWDNIWARVASALAQHEYDDKDIRWLLQNAGAFVLEATDAGHTVYRLFHRALAEILRSGKPLQRSQRSIVGALIGSVPRLPGDKGVDWLLANRYVRAHIATHAAAAGQLDRLVTQPIFLVATEPGSLLRVLSTVKTREGRQARLVYRMAAHHRTGDVSLGDWVSYLELTARENGVDWIANGLAALPAPRKWSTTWAYFDRSASHRILPGHQGPVRAVAIWKNTVISASDDETVRRWDLDTGAPVGESLEGHAGPVYCLAVDRIGKQAMIVSGGEDGTVRIWPLDEGTGSRLVLRGHQGAVKSVVLARIGNETVIVSGGVDGTVRFWNAAGELLGEPLQAHESVQALAYCQINGVGQLVTAGDGAAIRAWNPETRQLVRELKSADHSHGHLNMVTSLACIELDRKPVLVSAGQDGRVQRWDLGTGVPLGLPIHTDLVFIQAVCGSMLRKRPILVSAGLTGIGIWQADTTERVNASLAGHDKMVLALAVQYTATKSLVISGGLDSTVRIWDLDEALDGEVETRNVHVSDMWNVVASGSTSAVRSYDQMVRLFDNASGRIIFETARPSDGFRRGLALREAAGEMLLAVNGQSEVSLYRIREGSATESILPVIFGADDTLFFHDREGQQLLSAIGGDGKIITWDIESRNVVGSGHLDLHRGWHDDEKQWRDTIALGTRTDGTAVVISGGSGAGVIRIWHPENQRLEKEIRVSSQGNPDVGSNALAIDTIDGRVLAVSGDSDWKIRMWDAETGELVAERQTKGAVFTVQLGSLGEHAVVAWGGADHVLGIWWPGTSIDQVVDLGCPVYAIAFTGNGALLAATARGLVALRFEL